MYAFVKKTNIYFHQLKRDKERLQIIANVLPVALFSRRILSEFRNYTLRPIILNKLANNHKSHPRLKTQQQSLLNPSYWYEG